VSKKSVITSIADIFIVKVQAYSDSTKS